MTPDELRARVVEFMENNDLHDDGEHTCGYSHDLLGHNLESLCREMIAVGLESAGYRAETVAFLMGNDRWKERNALNEYAGACHQEAQRVKEGDHGTKEG